MFRNLIDTMGRSGKTILEIGCGAGSLIQLLAAPRPGMRSPRPM
jgi:cyclopropane fatty-acyl-phospholipid synthase-like methyltransferase